MLGLKSQLYTPEHIQQYSNKSITCGSSYDLKRYSRHEKNVIYSVLSTAKKKYPAKYQALGLANESSSIKYKPRYVLHEIIVLRYENSDAPLYQLAVALAYETMGASRRQRALLHFETAMTKINMLDISVFPCFSPSLIYSRFSKLYEKEHEYQKAISCLESAIQIPGTSAFALEQDIQKLRAKAANPPAKRKRKSDAETEEFFANVRAAAIHFDAKSKHHFHF